MHSLQYIIVSIVTFNTGTCIVKSLPRARTKNKQLLFKKENHISIDMGMFSERRLSVRMFGRSLQCQRDVPI